MLIFVRAGRLGNQLFQYAALRSHCRDGHALVLIGFDSLATVFDGVEARLLMPSNNLAVRGFQVVRQGLDRVVGAQPVVGTLAEVIDGERVRAADRPGWIGDVTYGLTGYYQSEMAFRPGAIRRLAIKPAYLEQAARFVHQEAAGRTPVFVHVRRGDYAVWPTRENPALVPEDWYRTCIAEMRRRHPDAVFFFASDDTGYVRQTFGDMDDVTILDGDEGRDLAVLSLCDAGIVSPSTFAWWGAYFARRRNPQATFLAPLHWAGHRLGRWFPEGIRSSFMEYVPVGSGAS